MILQLSKYRRAIRRWLDTSEQKQLLSILGVCWKNVYIENFNHKLILEKFERFQRKFRVPLRKNYDGNDEIDKRRLVFSIGNFMAVWLQYNST
jgi:transposase InsO family protein